MTQRETQRDNVCPGAATVGDLEHAGAADVLAIRLFRDWFEDDAGRLRVASILTSKSTRDAWLGLIGPLCDCGRRPVMRHALTCRCIGADEAVFAQILALAARGEREDAMLMLSLLIPADRLLTTCHCAQIVGLALMQAAGQHTARAEMTLH